MHKLFGVPVLGLVISSLRVATKGRGKRALVFLVSMMMMRSSQAEISQLNVVGLIEEYILRF
jgi:hypothetical protein